MKFWKFKAMSVDETIKETVIRYQNEYAYKMLYFLDGKDIVAVDIEKIKKKYNSDTVIKLFKTDFDLIKADMERLTHFNIQYCGHKPGKRYLIVRIEMPGYFDGTTERPPVLNKDIFMITECSAVRNNVQYNDLVESDFKYSLDNIKDVDSLKKTILRRYKESLAQIPEEQKLSLGVSITELKIIKRFSKDMTTT